MAAFLLGAALSPLAACDSARADAQLEVVVTADAGVDFIGEVSAIGTAGGGRIDVTETYGREIDGPEFGQELVLRITYDERLTGANGLEDWRLDELRVGAFTKVSEEPGVLRVEVLADGAVVDADEVREQGARTRFMRAHA